MQLSYWEKQTLLPNQDISIIGSGIVGLTSAIFLKRKYKERNVSIFERGVLPSGASTKNAGFACFGSLGELINDKKLSNQEDVINLLIERKKGLEELLNLTSKSSIDFQVNGGYELFKTDQIEEFNLCIDQLSDFNKLLQSEFKENVYESVANTFDFKGIHGLIKNKFEGQIDTGKMMFNLIEIAKELGVNIYNGIEVSQINQKTNGVELVLGDEYSLKSNEVAICTNGFAMQFLPKYNINPARAQVLITKPIENLSLKGTFHYDKGYYYFRNINNRILLGGGRNIAFEEENTTNMKCTSLIIDNLKELLAGAILPNTPHEIDYTWSGIMGVGENKKPFIEQVDANIFCGVKLGAMGVAIGSLVGKELSELI